MASKLKLTELLYPTSTTPAITINADDTVTFGAPTTTITNLSATNLSYTGTLTGGTGVLNIGSGQIYKDASGNVGLGTASPAGITNRNFTVSGVGVNAISMTAGDYSVNLGSLIPFVESFGNRNDGNVTFGGRFGASFRRSDGTAIASNTSIGYYAFGGQWGTDTSYQSAKHLYTASIVGVAEGSFTSASAMPTAIAFLTGSAGESLTAVNTVYGTERMRLDSSGNLLVGTTATSNTEGVLIGKGGAAGGGLVSLLKTNSGATNGLLNFYQTTYVGGINFDNTSTSFPTSSDIRLKKDIVDAPSALLKIQDIRIVSHGWKHDDAVVEFGVIAQELVSVAPNAVTQGDNGEKVITTWSVDYSKLVPLLIKAHQEQQAIITQLQADVAALKGAA